ncbi:MAG: hypothetical protein ACYDBY_06310 [Thermoanaerobaculia bacterium]
MPVTVEDLLPLVGKLTRAERIRLAQLALQAEDSEEREGPAEVYRIAPVQGHEVAYSEDPLSWESEGWEGIERTFPPGTS